MFPEIQFAAVSGWGTTAADRTALEKLPNVHLLEPREPFDAILAQTRLLLFPSLWQEAFPLTVVEAMLRGIPVLASNVGGVPEAKLGTDFVLPVQPIAGYTEQLDDQLLPVPVIPAQRPADLDEWHAALRALTTDRAFYDRHATAARTTAQQFVTTLSFDPFAAWLSRLDSQRRKSPPAVPSQLPEAAITPPPAPRTALSDKLAKLNPAQRALLMQWLQQSTPETNTAPPAIQSATRSDSLPLSYAQQRLWFLDRLYPGDPAYNVRFACRLRGPLHIAALERSVNAIVQRHEILRTTYAERHGEPVQVITPVPSHPEHDAPLVTLAIIDLHGMSRDEQEATVRQQVIAESERPFDLTQDLPVRVSLLRLHTTEHVLCLVVHHIAFDYWSRDIFYRELSAFYHAFTTASPVPPLPRLCQYADFAIWQRQWLQGPVFASQMDYWLQQLRGNLPTLELPTDWPRPAVQDTHAAQLTGDLSAQETQALKALGQQVHATPFMVLLAALQLLLCRYTGQDDIVVASPIANRQQQDTEQTLGLFLNTLVLRTSLAGHPTFRELLQHVRAVTLAAYDHQDVPFEKLVEAIHPTRDLSRPPLYDVMLNSLEQLGEAWAFADVAVETLGVEETRARCALTLYVREHQGGLAFRLVYQRALFAASRMQAFLDQYRHLLRQIITAPDQTIETYSLVAPEATALLPNPRHVLEQPLYEVVPQQCLTWAQRTPQHPAVMQGAHCWTYGELAERAETVAQALCAHGVARGDVVALYGPPSFGLIVSMLGVLRSGGVMLMLDPQLPPQRMRLMLQEAGTTACLQIGAPEAVDVWEQDAVGHILHIEPQTGRPQESLTTPAQTMPLPALQPDDAAYIFFTSGSTGIPKGVLGCHKGLSHFLQWQRETFRITAEDRVAQLTGLSFDVVLRDIFLPLTSGATLVLPHETDRQSGRDVVRWLDQQRITVVHAVPTIAQTWLADGPYETTLPALRLVFFAGEPLTEHLVHQWRAAFPHGTLVNLYGPTETTLAKCWYGIPTQVLPGVQPVGQPLPHTQALVVAGKQRLCGISEPGEIVIRTPYRSLGYIRTAGENASRFVPNPWSGDVQDWLYYTGDRGRYRPDGTLEVLGRLDDQVKIRGVRIEPGEVTAVLQRHPGVQAGVVTARRDQYGQFFLAAYVVTAQLQQTTPGLLRTFLRHYLPTVMLPTTFTYLEHLPLTPTGKVDRRALPAPGADTTDMQTSYVAPRTPIELSLVAIWRDLLAAQAIGIYDDFFDLGGHSLLATRVLARIREQFHMELPLRALFEQPTVAGLAIIIAQTYAEQIVDDGLATLLAEVEGEKAIQ